MKIYEILYGLLGKIKEQTFDIWVNLTDEEQQLLMNKEELTQFKMIYGIEHFKVSLTFAECLCKILSDETTILDILNLIVCSYPDILKVTKEVFPEFEYI